MCMCNFKKQRKIIVIYYCDYVSLVQLKADLEVHKQ